MEVAAEIQKLKVLHDQGALTDEEFGAAKKQVLAAAASRPGGVSHKNTVGHAANNFVKFIIVGAVLFFVIAAIFFFTFWLPQWKKISSENEIFSKQVDEQIDDAQKDMKSRRAEFDKNFKKQSEEMDQFRKKNGLN